jgi:hypothetical protein
MKTDISSPNVASDHQKRIQRENGRLISTQGPPFVNYSVAGNYFFLIDGYTSCWPDVPE